MNVRIISGQYGGRKLDAPDNDQTHPMGERVRNALFNSLGTTLQDARVLDAFAGTGALGLEALSRGARDAVFVEKDKTAQQILAKNISLLSVDDQSTIIRTTVNNWIETANDAMNFDIIFVDPPYHDPQFSTVSKLMGLLKSDGLMVLSHPGKGEVPIRSGIVVVDNRSYGNAHLTFFRRDA